MLDRMTNRRRSSRVALSYLMAACSTLPACGGGAAPSTPAVEAAAGPVVTAAPAGAPPISAPAEPDSLFLIARWKGPVRSAERALSALGVPIAVEALLDQQMPNASRVIDFEGSVDLAVGFNPSSTDPLKVFAGLSLPLRSFDDAIALAAREHREVVTVRPGVVQTPSPDGGKECLIVQSAAGPGARLVCAETTRELDRLGEWMARGLGGTPPETDGLVATLRGAPLKERFLKQLRTAATQTGDEVRDLFAAQNVTDPNLVAAPGIVADEGIRFLEDVSAVELHVSLTSTPPQLAVGGALRFGASSSWLTRLLLSSNEKAGPPPALFWHAPRDASSALWVRRGNPHLFNGVSRVLRKGLAASFKRLPIVASGDRQVVEAFLDSAFTAAAPTLTATWVSAHGVLHVEKKRPAVSANPTPAAILAEARRVATRGLGWQLVGVDAPAAEYIAWGKQSVDLFTRAVELIRSFLPPAGKATEKDRRTLKLLPRLTTVTSLPGWPRGTVAFNLVIAYDGELAELVTSLRSAPPPKGAPGPAAGAMGTITFRVAVVPDGNHTWIGVSANLDELQKRLTASLDSAPREGTLAARDGLEALNDPGQTWGGFFSVSTLVERVFDPVKEVAGIKLNGLLAQMPDHGRTPVLWGGTGTNGPTPTSAMTLRFQAGTLTDVATLVKLATTPEGEEQLGKMLDKVERQ